MAPHAAQAHFQLLYTPDVHIAKPGDVPVVAVFTHPMENGHAMDMGTPEDFYMIHRGKKIDLKDRLTPITWTGASNTAKAYTATVPVKRNGDYIMVLQAAPYFEQSEGLYIQHITKSYINKGNIPTDWNTPQGLKTEIVPLNKPTQILAGSTFTGQLLSEGKPAAGIEIEIEYMSAEPDMEKLAPGTVTAQPLDSTLIAVTDANGMFTFGIPKAGFWGFAALGSGPDKEFNGKELEQDAVIWIHAVDLK
jgi:cobalt/nickel transport protein